MMIPKTNKAELEARVFPVEFDVFNPSLIIPSKTIGIYKITSPSGKIYIGQSRDIRRRMEVYRRMKTKSQTKIHNSFLKHGLDKHMFEIVCICSIEELNDLECYYMNLYDSFNSESGLNLKIGGNVKIKISDDTRQKLRDSHKGQVAWNKGIPMTQEAIEYLRKINTGSKRTEEQKQKLRVPKKKPRTEEHKKNNADANRGKKRTEEQRLARIERNKNNPSPLKGKPRSPETIQKLKDFYAAKRETPEYIEKQKLKAIKKEEDRLERKRIAEENKKNRIPLKGELNPLYGKKLTEEHKQKLRDGHKNSEKSKKRSPPSEQTRSKIGKSNKGKKRTDEQRKRMSEACKGRKRSPETSSKIKETKRLILEEKRMMIF